MDEPNAKKLSALDATLLVMGGIIGVGIFFTPQIAAGRAYETWAMLGVWLFGGGVALCAAFTFAELGASFPKAGGWFVYLREAFGPFPAFLFAWVVLTVVSTGATAAVAKFGVLQLSSALPSVVSGDETGQLAWAIGILLVITLVAASGVKSAALVQNICMVSKLAVLALLVVCGLVLVTPASDVAVAAGAAQAQALTERPDSLLDGVLSALLPVFFAYGGWQMVSYIAPQVERPTRTLPRAIVFGVAGVIAVYLVANFSFIHALGIEGLAADPGFASRIASDALGSTGQRLLSAGIAVSALGWCVVNIVTTPWLYVAMAREGLFFERFAKLHPVRGVPLLALFLQATITILYVCAGELGFLVDAVVFVEWVFHGLVAWALVSMRRGRPEIERPYASPLFPLAPLVYLVAALLVVGSTLWLADWDVRRTGILVLASGAIVYALWRRGVSAAGARA